MTDVPDFKMPIAGTDFAKFAVEVIIASAKPKTCEHYEELFGSEAMRLADQQNHEGFQVFRILAAACSLVPQFGDIKHPFRPKVVDFVKGCSSVGVEHFTDEQCAAFKETLSTISDDELRARLADVVILNKFDHRVVTTAAEAYLKAALSLRSEDRWFPCVERLRRACWLSSRPGIDKAVKAKTIDEIKTLIANFHPKETGLFTAHLISLVVMFDAASAANYAEIVRELAIKARTNRRWHVARGYFEVAHNIFRAVKPQEEEKAIAAAGEVAETFALEAENAENASPPELGKACHCYEEAREAYAGIKGQQQRRAELYKKLLMCQEKSISETTFTNLAVEIPTPDLASLINHSREAVKGKPFPEAVLALLKLFASPNFEETAKQIRCPDDGSSVWSDIIPMRRVDIHGKTKAYKEAVSAEGFDEALRFDYAYCQSHAKSHWWLAVSGIIFPALQQLTAEHAIRLEDMEFITENNSLVPLNRIRLISRGLYYGFLGDFALALHLLIPQFENSLRCVLHQRGEVSSAIDSEGIQDERNINTLLREHPALERIFGKDLMWDFWALLAAKWGGNIRNQTAHGLTADDDFSNPESIYAWGLLLKFYCLPLLVQSQPGSSASES